MASKQFIQKPKFQSNPWFRSLKSKSQSDLTRTRKQNLVATNSPSEEGTSTNDGANVAANNYQRNKFFYSSFKLTNSDQNNRQGKKSFSSDHNQNGYKGARVLDSKSSSDFMDEKKNYNLSYRNHNKSNEFDNQNNQNCNIGNQNGVSTNNKDSMVQNIYIEDDTNLNKTSNATPHLDTSKEVIDVPVIAYIVEDVDDSNENPVVFGETEFFIAIGKNDDDDDDNWNNLNENQRKNDDLIETLKSQIDFLNNQLKEAGKDDSKIINELSEKIENLAKMNQVSYFVILYRIIISQVKKFFY